jgi:predicted secreted Zn-dependent protease
MPEDSNPDDHDQQRAERVHPVKEPPRASVGLLSAGIQTDFYPATVEDGRYPGGSPPSPPDYPLSLVGDPALYEHGNEPVRISVINRAQRTYGNRAVQRILQRRSASPALPSTPIPVQRDDPPGSVAKAPTSTENVKITNDTFDIDGETLADAAAVLQGMGDAADTTWKPVYNSNETDGRVTSVTIDVEVNVLMPNWPGASKLNKEARAEWDRAYKALADHEQGHVDLVKKMLKGVATKMVGKTKAQADAIFNKAVADLKKESDAYDTRTDHGRKTGTVINVDAGSKPKPKSESGSGTKQSTSPALEGAGSNLPGEGQEQPLPEGQGAEQ